VKNADFNTRHVKSCCEKKLGITFRSGGEFNGWYRLEGKKAARITIPKGRKPIPEKTYKSMAMQLRLRVSEFDALLECPLSNDEYQKILHGRS
jgi:hypothetical protein